MKKTEKKSTVSVVFNVIGVLLCVILIPVLVLNLTLIIKSYTNKDQVPSFGGYLPMIVLTDSMYPAIASGDLIIDHTVDPATLKVGDIISYFDPESQSGESIVTHRITEITKDEEGKLAFITKGDFNNTADKTPVPADSVVGIYNFLIPHGGNVAMFMQTTTGLIVCVVVPLVLLVAYDVIRRKLYDKNHKTDADALLAELEALKAEKAQAEKAQAENVEKEKTEAEKVESGDKGE